VICKKKLEKEALYRFAVIDVEGTKEIVFDLKHKLKGRGYYVCKGEGKCRNYLQDWAKKKKYK
jgi:predicted RNA-binding protein YlxR (DUF448 family)